MKTVKKPASALTFSHSVGMCLRHTRTNQDKPLLVAPVTSVTSERRPCLAC
jgi:hypothetical protein